MAPFDRPLYDFILVGHCKYITILYHFRDKARYWSKIAIFEYPLYVRGFLSEYCHNVWYRKTRTV